jgi:hypothetical protein
LLERIIAADHRATKLGYETERGITQFISLTFAVRPDFDAMPQVSAYLNLPRPAADTKIQYLVEALYALKDRDQRQASMEKALARVNQALSLIIGLLLSPIMLSMGGHSWGQEPKREIGS